MKKIVLTMLAMMAFGSLMAQDNKDAEQRAPKKMTPEEMTERMTKELDLNEDQQAKVLDLNKEYEDVINHPAMHKGSRGPRPEGKMKKADGMRKPEAKQKAEAKEQKAEAKEKKAEAKEKKAEANQDTDGETGATKRPERAERPEMTEAQKAERQKRMERRKEYDGKLKEVLTPEQFEKYQQHRHHRPHGPNGGPRR